MKRYTIAVDNREKDPLIFPACLRILSPGKLPASCAEQVVEIATISVRMLVGDYRLHRDDTGTIIERKGSLKECASNCLTHDRKRFIKALDRLAGQCRNPIVLVEGSPSQVFGESIWLGDRKVPAGIAVDAFIRACLERHITPLFLPSTTRPQRMAVGEYVARLLIASAVTTRIPQELLHGATADP